MKIQYIAFSFLTLMLVGCGQKPADTFKAPIVPNKPAVEKTTPETTMNEDTDGTYVLSASTMTWAGSKVVGGAHEGTVEISEGMFMVEDGELESGSFVVNMNTILEDGQEGGAVKHLKNEDFFDVPNHPTATVVLKSATKTDTGADIVADLTIKGNTNEIQFPATMMVEGDMLKVQAAFDIDRTKWGIQYGSGSIFDDLGDAAIKDEMSFTLDLTFEKKMGDEDMEDDGEMEDDMDDMMDDMDMDDEDEMDEEGEE